ncbi:TKL TKL-ccin kinase [Pyrrhoderma noxium]|uniref:TKL TKL-ccin kinase n=1 Tax=Pyrrhoderma noxium TaxID=2282107 RepID=A0A286U8Q4_9AGAM|nr:TKL TKL-ccin kinase [Pyrrhoderma noxium]
MKSASVFGPPSVFPHALRELSVYILPRLRLIPELRCWLPQSPTFQSAFSYPYSSALHVYDEVDSSDLEEPTKVLYNSLVQGAPLLILLDLLGSRTGGSSLLYAEDEEQGGDKLSLVLIAEFVRRIEILEAQGVLGYGESFKVAEFLSGECSGFIKVLKIVQRVLNCLEATYPNVYELPPSSLREKEEFLENMVDNEVNYLADIREMEVAINEAMDALPQEHIMSTECLIMHLSRIIIYQEHIVNYLQRQNVHSTDYIFWDELFGLKSEQFFAGAGAYQSYCSQYPTFVVIIEQLLSENVQKKALLDKYTFIKDFLSRPIEHIFKYSQICSLTLSYTHPQEKAPIFDSLCLTLFTLNTLAENFNEMLTSIENNQAETGRFIYDDCLFSVPDNSDQNNLGPQVFAFLFEKMMLLGLVHDREDSTISNSDIQYSRATWDLGPGLRMSTFKKIVELQSIPLSAIVSMERFSTNTPRLTIDWERKDTGYNSITLSYKSDAQINLWISLISRFAPDDTFIPSSDSSTANNYTDSDASVTLSWGSSSISWQDEIDLSIQRTNSRAKPWSVIARVGEGKDTPDPSVFRFFNSSEQSLLSPRLVSTSPRSLSPVPSLGFQRTADPESASLLSSADSRLYKTKESGYGEYNDKDTCIPKSGSDISRCDGSLLDLTCQIKRTGKYPTAHGGFADVWKCEWVSGSRHYDTVAVKVLRGRLLDMEREEKLGRRLHRELNIWKRLKHKNVVPLYGTCSDFGRYTSLVCPWYENGSLHHYIRRKHLPDGTLSVSERLRLLSEIACGLGYLHDNSVIHGDLSSANVLINDRLQACISDFGLSVIIEDLRDVSDPLGGAYPSSVLGGAVRWAAPELFSIDDVNSEPGVGGPQLTASCDIYSMGCIALEVITGKIPYEHLKNDGQVLIALSRRVKSPRIPSPFLTDPLWVLINTCWYDDPTFRPSAIDLEKQIRDIANI